MWSLSEAKPEQCELTEDCGFMAGTGREKDSGESQQTESGRDGNWRNQFASTIKERNSRDYVD